MFTQEPDEAVGGVPGPPPSAPRARGQVHPSLLPVPGPLLSPAAAALAVRAWDAAVGSLLGLTLCEPEVVTGGPRAYKMFGSSGTSVLVEIKIF